MFRYNMINKNNTEMKSEVAKGEILYKLYIGDFIYKSGISPIIGANGVSWIEITFNGVKGWIDMSRLANATKHKRGINIAYSKLKSFPCSNNTLDTVNYNDMLLVYPRNGIIDSKGVEWSEVSCNGIDGWIQSEHIE